MNLKGKDLKVTVFQSRKFPEIQEKCSNFAVRLEHIPTGIIVEADESLSQVKNNAIARKLLKEKLEDEAWLNFDEGNIEPYDWGDINPDEIGEKIEW